MTDRSTDVMERKAPVALDEESCWEATLRRDTGLDGAFVYAVRSTGIYCRPSCPARRPRRDQVLFFPAPDAAERAGFRACRRCRPRQAAPQADLVHRACRYIDEHLDGPLTLEALGAALEVSPYHLQRTFKRVMRITPRQYAEVRRVEHVKTHLRDGGDVTTALYDAGYGSSSRFYERAGAHLGMTPSAYRRGARGLRITYTIVDCALGRLLVGTTERGVCAVSLGDRDADLEAFLNREYPAAEISREDDDHAAWVDAIVRHLDGREPQLDLPVDVQATAFQWRVWETLRAIPYGSTRSYGEIARAIGEPAAARAVAKACATNPVAVVIPCHRAVRGDGGTGGYRWGVARKRALLERERAASAAAV